MKAKHAHRPSDGEPKPRVATTYHGRHDAECVAYARAAAKRIEAELVELDNRTRRIYGKPAVARLEEVHYH